MAMVVLPVLRSPMISSRWPRPIGVIASIDLMPVCSGSCTGLRPVMPGAWISMRRGCTPVSSPAPVDRLAEGVDDATEHAVADGHRQDAPGRLDGLTLLDRVDVAEHDGADRLLVEVEREADGAVLELEQLVHGGVGQPGHAGDAVADLGDAADGAGLERRREAVEVRLERGGDVGGGEREFSHVVGSSGAASCLEAGLQLVETGADGAVDDGVADGGDEAAEHASGRRSTLTLTLRAGGVGERGRADGRCWSGGERRRRCAPRRPARPSTRRPAARAGRRWPAGRGRGPTRRPSR